MEEDKEVTVNPQPVRPKIGGLPHPDEIFKPKQKKKTDDLENEKGEA